MASTGVRVYGVDTFRFQGNTQLARFLHDAVVEVADTTIVCLCFFEVGMAELTCVVVSASGIVCANLLAWSQRVHGRVGGTWIRESGTDGLEIVNADETPFAKANHQRKWFGRCFGDVTGASTYHPVEPVRCGFVQVPELCVTFSDPATPGWFQMGMDSFCAMLRTRATQSGPFTRRWIADRVRDLGFDPTKPVAILGAEPPCKDSSAEKRAQPVLRHRAIEAGAGAGKTEALASLIVATLEHDKSHRIFAISYTNRARNVLRDRVTKLAERKIHWERVRFGTIHHLAQTLANGGTDPPRILDKASARKVLAHAAGRDVPDHEIDSMERAVCASDGTRIQWHEPGHAELWERWRSALAERKETTFTGILADGLAAVDSADLPFTHLFVDEFQDTNGLQMELLRRAARRGVTVTAVGDPEQSIFGFAGAVPDAMDVFGRDFQPERERIDGNRRSGRKIVDLANALRVDGKAQIPRRGSNSDVPEGWVCVRRYPTAETAAAMVASEIACRIAPCPWEGQSPEQFAILARTRWELDRFSAELTKRGIAVCREPTRFATRRKNPLVLALMRAVADPDAVDPVALALEALGETRAAGQLRDVARQSQPLSVSATIGLLENGNAVRVEGVLAKLRAIPGPDVTPGDRFASLFEVIVRPTLGFFETSAERIREIREDIDAIALLDQTRRVDWKTLADSIENEDPIAVAADRGVRLATVHESKGEEWRFVVVADVGARSFPHPRTDNPAEERRLLYVACTRAADELQLVHHGSGEISPFLKSPVADDRGGVRSG